MPAVRHVVLNALFLDPGVSGGPETYLRGLAPALTRERPEVRLTVVTTGAGAEALRADGWGEWASIRALPCEDGQRLRRTFAEQALLPALARRERADVLHSLASVAPVRPTVPAAITLHDVTFIRRRTFGAMTTKGMQEIISRAARGAGALLTASGAARDEICATLGLDPDRFSVVPHGAGRPSAQTQEPSVAQARHRLAGARVVLCVAAKRPHKNQELLVRALRHLPEHVVLVLAGHAEPYEQELRRLAEEEGVGERVRFVGYVPDDELEALWRLSDCAAFPTLGEGFGLPVLEAMSRGVAVACSDIPVLREVGGDLPEYFAPHDPMAAAAAIERAWGRPDPELGRRRAGEFTWESAAQGTFEAYERAARAQR